jgi:hypothetical protein
MNRIPLGYFLIVGLVFWGLPAVVVVGPRAIEYTILAVLPVWWLCRRDGLSAIPPGRHLSTRTCMVLAVFSMSYFVWDALYGRQLLQFNMFLFGKQGTDQLIQGYNTSMGKGGGVADLLGYIFSLLPLALIDGARETSRYGRWILWSIALLGVFYEVASGRGFLLMVIIAIMAGRTSNWRRLLVAAPVALGLFLVASSLRAGGADQAGNPILSGTVTPFINLGLLANAHCGSAPWYSFIVEFLKKFVPAFLVPKEIFSFNMEMSLCIYPSLDNTVESVSIFTWLGEILYYTPSPLTAIAAGFILAILAHTVDRQLAKNGLYSARLFAGFLCILMPRSRTQDIFTFLIAQLIFLAFFWPHLCNLTRTLRRLLPPPDPVGVRSEPGGQVL